MACLGKPERVGGDGATTSPTGRFRHSYSLTARLLHERFLGVPVPDNEESRTKTTAKRTPARSGEGT